MLKKSVFAAILLLLSAFAVFANDQVPANVVGVSDGDTLKAIIDGTQVKIRLYGIDTPEKAQSYGQVATEELKKQTRGHAITIQAVDHDRYGRTVGLVFADGFNVNESMVKAGAAWVYRQYCKLPFCVEWERYQQEARTAGAGLWHDPDPMPPWEWRHGGGKKSIAAASTDSKKGDVAGIEYHGNVKSHKFHKPGCRHYDCNNCTKVFHSRDEAISSGYTPCKLCNP